MELLSPSVQLKSGGSLEAADGDCFTYTRDPSIMDCDGIKGLVREGSVHEMRAFRWPWIALQKARNRLKTNLKTISVNTL